MLSVRVLDFLPKITNVFQKRRKSLINLCDYFSSQDTAAAVTVVMEVKCN